MTTKANDNARRTIRSVKERAEEGGLSVKSIRREIAVGNIEIVRLGPGRRRIGISEAAWQAYIRSRTS